LVSPRAPKVTNATRAYPPGLRRFAGTRSFDRRSCAVQLSLNMGPLDRRALEVGYFLVLASVVVFLATPSEAASFGVPVMAGGVLLAWLCEDVRGS
jgi:hypothetical protein